MSIQYKTFLCTIMICFLYSLAAADTERGSKENIRSAKELVLPNGAKEVVNCSVDPGNFVGRWERTDQRTSDPGHREVLQIRQFRAPETEFYVQSSVGNELFNKVYKIECEDKRTSLVSYLVNHNCLHKIEITSFQSEPIHALNGDSQGEDERPTESSDTDNETSSLVVSLAHQHHGHITGWHSHSEESSYEDDPCGPEHHPGSAHYHDSEPDD